MITEKLANHWLWLEKNDPNRYMAMVNILRVGYHFMDNIGLVMVISVLATVWIDMSLFIQPDPRWNSLSLYGLKAYQKRMILLVLIAYYAILPLSIIASQVIIDSAKRYFEKYPESEERVSKMLNKPAS